MISLGKIAALAFFTLGIVASTVPTKRQSDLTAVGVLNNLADEITPIAAQFTFLTPANATPANVQGILDQMNPFFVDTSAKIGAALQAQSAADVSATMQAMADVINAVYTPMRKLSATAGISVEVFLPSIGTYLNQFLPAVFVAFLNSLS
ncbi:unnamed protein product [Peniophora sp. CBMAI 1063]|nr:unnamed protein product [Peniophora sp. CBMAI 1063]